MSLTVCSLKELSQLCSTENKTHSLHVEDRRLVLQCAFHHFSIPQVVMSDILVLGETLFCSSCLKSLLLENIDPNDG